MSERSSLPRLASLRAAVVGACASLLAGAGCILSTDLSGTAFLCTEDPVCPEGSICVDGRCVAGEPPDGDGGGGGGGAEGDELGDFAFRQRLDIDNRGRGELRDFPLLVALDPVRFDYAASRPDGADLEFHDSDGARIPHEIEDWNLDGRSLIWVRVPLVDAGSNTDFIYLYYGDPAAEVAQDEASVFRSYESVYHLDDGGQEIDDAGARNYDGTPIGSEAAAGFLARGRSLSGAGQYIDLGSQRNFGRAAPGLTVEAWVNPQVAQSGVIFGASVNTQPESRIELRLQPEQVLRGGARTQDSGDLQDLQFALTGQLLPLDAWTWVALVCDFPAGEISIYINDQLDLRQGGFLFDALTPDTPSARAAIGANESLDSDFFGGLLDEVRLAPAAMNADWVSAQYASMVDELVSYGPPEAL